MRGKIMLCRLGAALTLSSLLVRSAVAQTRPVGAEIIPLTVQLGVPLHVVLTKAVPIKHEGVPVEGRLVDAVYVFDRIVIPAGSEILGRVSRVESMSRGQRALAIADGDFTPRRKAHVEFDTLVLNDGRRLPLQAVVSQGVPAVIHLSAGVKGKKKGRVSQAVQQARQEAKARAEDTVIAIKAPGKMKRLKSILAAEMPYHRQKLAVGTRYTAELTAPLHLGQEQRSSQDLEKVGSEIPPGSLVHVRLVTGLSSAISRKGSAVAAVVSEPVFSRHHQLILPEGARLAGVVTQSRPARRLDRNGQLRFMFRRIDVAARPARRVEASLHAVDAPMSAHLRLDSEGGARAVTPKTRFIAPAVDVLLATSSLDGLDPHNHRRIEEGLGRQGPDYVGGAIRGGAGFGLVGTVVGFLAHFRPVSACFAFYGAGMSVYSHIVARGTDVVFPRDTEMEIRFGTHESPATSARKNHPLVSAISKSTNRY
jgi:hypothetical protein